MNQQQGFSLVEVLASLLLTTALALSLLQQQMQSRQVLNQLVLREQGSQFLDQIDETLLMRIKKLPATPAPYHLNTKHRSLHLAWYKQLEAITRNRTFIDGLR